MPKDLLPGAAPPVIRAARSRRRRRTRTMLKDLLPDEAFLRALYRGVKAGDGRLAMWLQEASPSA